MFMLLLIAWTCEVFPSQVADGEDMKHHIDSQLSYLSYEVYMFACSRCDNTLFHNLFRVIVILTHNRGVVSDEDFI